MYAFSLFPEEPQMVTKHRDEFIHIAIRMHGHPSEEINTAFENKLRELTRNVNFMKDKYAQRKPKSNPVTGVAKYPKPLQTPDINDKSQLGIKVLVSNYSNKDNKFNEAVNAERGDELFYKIMIYNPTSSEFKDLAAYIQMPAIGLSYVNGYSKLYYKDQSGKGQVAGLVGGK